MNEKRTPTRKSRTFTEEVDCAMLEVIEVELRKGNQIDQDVPCCDWPKCAKPKEPKTGEKVGKECTNNYVRALLPVCYCEYGCGQESKGDP